MNKTYRYESARVSGALLGGSGVVEAVYSGPLTTDGFDVLRREVLRHTQPAPCVVLRMDRTITLMDMPAIPSGTYLPRAASGAVIVRRDQYEMWAAYARKLSQVGILRAVFLDTHAPMAYEWALRQAAVSHAQLAQ